MAAAERISTERISIEELDADLLEEMRDSSADPWDLSPEGTPAIEAPPEPSDRFDLDDVMHTLEPAEPGALALPPRVRTVRDSQAPDEIPSPQPLRAVPLASPPVPRKASLPKASLPTASLPTASLPPASLPPARPIARSGRVPASALPPLQAPPRKAGPSPAPPRIEARPRAAERPPAPDSLAPPPMGDDLLTGPMLAAQSLPTIPGAGDSLAPAKERAGLGWPGVFGVAIACFALGVVVTWAFLQPSGATVREPASASRATPAAAVEPEPAEAEPSEAERAEAEAAAEEPTVEDEPRDAIAAIVEASARIQPERRSPRRRARQPRAAAQTAPTPAPPTTPAAAPPAVEAGPVAAARPASPPAAALNNLPSQPSRNDVREAIARIQPAVQACAPSMRGHVANIRFRFISNGQATLATVSADTINNPAQRSCMARVARNAYVPPFAERQLVVTYPVQL